MRAITHSVTSVFHNRICVLFSGVCDGFRCLNAPLTCVQSVSLCDGVFNCADSEDEVTDNCRQFCVDSEFLTQADRKASTPTKNNKKPLLVDLNDETSILGFRHDFLDLRT